jgi:hypothetical protein
MKKIFSWVKFAVIIVKSLSKRILIKRRNWEKVKRIYPNRSIKISLGRTINQVFEKPLQ